MSWADLQRIIHGYQIREDKAWQRTRAIVAMIYNRSVKKGGQKKPEQLIPLAIDRAHRPKMTEDKKRQIREAQKRWKFKEQKNGNRKKSDSLDQGKSKP